jgi:propanol-preferring alcohol dehydrogenase
MKAMILEEQNSPLVLKDVPKPQIKADQLLIKVKACAICRTDLHIIEGDLKNPKLPLILGHQIVGVIEEMDEKVSGFKIGDRIGVPWLGNTCHHCEYCLEDKENLCDSAKFTGYEIDGGLAEYTTCDYQFAYKLPKEFEDEKVAPLLCAGLIGYRSYKKTEAKKTIGMYGFGVAAHILTQLAVYQKKEVYAFTREGDKKGQEFAKILGAVWAGDTDTIFEEKLDAAIIFAPVGDLVPKALKSLKKGGKIICAGIHMSDIPSFPYKDLWGERVIESVANLTREDGEEFLELAKKANIETKINLYPLEKTNKAIEDFRSGKLEGAAVIKIGN